MRPQDWQAAAGTPVLLFPALILLCDAPALPRTPGRVCAACGMLLRNQLVNDVPETLPGRAGG